MHFADPRRVADIVNLSGQVFGNTGLVESVVRARPGTNNNEVCFDEFLGPAGGPALVKGGFDILRNSGFAFDHHEVARVWANGSVIRGWLMELVARAFQEDGELEYLSGEIADSGEGKWTVETALEQGVSIPVIADALFRRYRSRSKDNFSDKVVAALRHEFGGHGFIPKKK